VSGPTNLEVLLEVPDRIREGLASGYLKPWGGTIRDPQGHIRALLTGGRALLQRDTPFDPKLLTDAIGHAQTAAHIASGIGLLNLGVSVAGFIMVRQRLDDIAGRLTQVLHKLAEVKEEVVWIGGLQMATIKAGMDAALDMAARAQRQKNHQLFNDAQTEAFKVRRTLHHAMENMLDRRRALHRPEAFLGFVQASVILAVTEAQCDESVEGVEEAGEALRQAARDLQRLVDAFDQQRRDVLHDPRTMIELGSEGRARIAAVSPELMAAVRQMEGTAAQLALREALGMTLVEWGAFAAPEGSGLVTCIVAPASPETDLVKLARHNAERTR
jgi:hypothetical protein